MFARLILSALLAAASTSVLAQSLPEGFLCCSMRTDGSKISDGSYSVSGNWVLPPGTPIKATAYARNRVDVTIAGEKQALSNDYSRDLSLETFAKRYIVAVDPQIQIRTFPQRTRDAIKTSRLLLGMTREQVLMSQGYPMSSENPRLDAKVWRYWLDSFNEFQVVFDDKDVVKEITGLPTVREQVTLD